MSPELLNLFQTSLIETLWMVGVSAALGTLLGLPIGVLLVVTDRQGLLEHLPFNRVLGVIANAVRSTPFIILLVAVIPFTRWVVGTSIGWQANRGTGSFSTCSTAQMAASTESAWPWSPGSGWVSITANVTCWGERSRERSGCEGQSKPVFT